MSELIEYIVIVHNIEDKQALHDEIINSGGSECVPDREIECALNPTSSRCTHYMMTEEEAELLKTDPRVWDISRTAQDLGIEIVPVSSYTQTSNLWSRGYISAQGDNNWGILRAVEGVQRFQWGSDSPQQLYDVSATVNIPHAGDNVDVVIVDGHADPAHPEYAVNSDGTGGTRYNQVNWLGLNSGLWGTTNGTYIYTPYGQSQGASAALEANNAHGSHVAGTACGNTNGWARKANIYNIYPYGNDSNTFDFTTKQFIQQYFFEYVRYWHQTKAINPATGTRNPTIMNNSWETGITVDISSITSINYQGTTYTAPSGGFTQATLNSYGIPDYTSTQIRFPIRYSPYESQVQDCINAGIIVTAAAGNSSYKIARDDQSGTDPDYNNSVTFTSNGSSVTLNYNRGSFLACSNTILVGALSSSYIDIKSGYSNTGPRIDVFSPGSYIMSSFFNTTSYGGVPDARNTNYYQGKISGTSMACPQVTGLLATLLELFPSATQADAQTYIASYSKTGQMQDGGYNVINPNYDTGKLQGAPNRTLYAYWPPTPTATVAIPSVTVKTGSEVKFTPVVGSGGVGNLVYTINPALPSGTSFTGWIESIPGNTANAYLHVTSPNAPVLQVNDYVTGSGIVDGTFLSFPTDGTQATFTIYPGYSSNIGSAGSPITFNNGMHINATTGEITGRTDTSQGATSYTITVTGNGISTSGQFTLAVNNQAIAYETNEVPYGSDPLQRCDIYQQPNVTPQGVIIWVHGGGFTGGAKSPFGFQNTQGGYWINDFHQINQLAKQGYIVINCNYRLANASGSDDANQYVPAGGSTGNYFPAGGNDIETVIRFCTISGAGSSFSSIWDQIVTAVNTYGLILSGASAGGWMVAYAGMKYINDYGNNKILAICPVVGPMDLDYVTLNDSTISTTAKGIADNFINSSPNNSSALRAASPRYLYGTTGSPGIWHSAVLNSGVKWIFVNNLNDTLVVPSLTDNFINILQSELGNTRVRYIKLNEGSRWSSTIINHNLESPLSIIIETIASVAFSLTPQVQTASKIIVAGTSIGTFSPITFVGGSGTKTYSISPSLPAGLSFNTTTGTITGTPTNSSQTTTYTITATDAANNTASATFTLSVLAYNVGGGSVVNHNDWNLLQSKISAVLGTPDGQTVDLGWNQSGSITSSQVSTNAKITGIEFDQIAKDVDTCYQQIANTRYQPTSRVPTSSNYLVTQSDYTGLSAAVDYCYSNRTTASSSKLTSYNWSAHDGPFSFNSVFGYHIWVDFGSNTRFREFWNGGGYINLSFDFVPSDNSPVNQSVYDLTTNMGGFRLSRTSFQQLNATGGYTGTVNIPGGVYGGNLPQDPDPINNPGVQNMILISEKEAHYTDSYFNLFIGLDSTNLFNATSITIIGSYVNSYTGQGGFTTGPSGRFGEYINVVLPFNMSAPVFNHSYNYIDGTYGYANGNIAPFSLMRGGQK